MIEVRFRNLPGHKKILRKEFALYDPNTGRDISQENRWEGVFLPGSRYHMSVVFFEDGVRPVPTKNAFCPKCFLRTEGRSDIDINW